jgi:hypothetical protein
MILTVAAAFAAMVGAYLIPTFVPLRTAIGFSFAMGVILLVIGGALHWFGRDRRE